MNNIFFGIENISFFDSFWVAVHFASGLLIGLAIDWYFRRRRGGYSGISFARLGFCLLLLWEYFEVSLRYMQKYHLRIENFMQIVLPNSFFSIESVTNVLSDLVIGSVGLYFTYRYLRRGLQDSRESEA